MLPQRQRLRRVSFTAVPLRFLEIFTRFSNSMEMIIIQNLSFCHREEYQLEHDTPIETREEDDESSRNNYRHIDRMFHHPVVKTESNW